MKTKQTLTSRLGYLLNSVRNSKEKQNLLSNFMYMVLLQGANYILPLITIPYIARVISPEHFGLVSYAQAFITYTTLCINYGFDFTATRDIAANKGYPRRISVFFSQVIYAKALLFFLCTLFFILIVFTIPRFAKDYEIYLITYLANIGFVLLPNWYYQGISKLKYIAVFNLLIKIVFTILIFALVKEDMDYLYIPLSTSVGQILIGALSFYFAIRYFKITIFKINFRSIIHYLKDGVSVFASTVAINIYTTTNIIILGFLTNNEVVGLFSASSKLVVIIASAIMFPISLTLFPYIGSKLRSSIDEGNAVLQKAVVIIAVATFSLSVALYLFAGKIIFLVFGEQYIEAERSLKIMAVIPFIVGLNNLFGTQGLLNLKQDKQFLTVTLAGSLLSVLLNLFFIPLYAEVGTAIAWVITEIFITICFICLYYKALNRLKKYNKLIV